MAHWKLGPDLLPASNISAKIINVQKRKSKSGVLPHGEGSFLNNSATFGVCLEVRNSSSNRVILKVIGSFGVRDFKDSLYAVSLM